MRIASSLAVALVAVLASGCDDPRSLPAAVQAIVAKPCDFLDCGAFGTCAGDGDGAPRCLCDLGYQGARCDICAGQFHRSFDEVCVTDVSCAEMDEDPCGAMGHCIDVDGVVACECEEGYEGSRCELCEDRFARDSDGRCLPLTFGAAGDSGAMTCATGYAGAFCTECDSGYHYDADACTRDATCTESTCSDHATCKVVGGRVKCTCLPEYLGTLCLACAPGHHPDQDACVLDEVCESSTCPEGSTCRVVEGRTACPCDPGYEGDACGQCAPGYHDEAGACVVDQACEPDSCPKTAACAVVDGVVQCTCLPGYTGDGCALCEPGFHGLGAECVLDEFCQADSCPGHALCDVVEGLVTCPCVQGWDPEGACDHCVAYAVERTGFEFPYGWSTGANQCQLRRELSVVGMSFESRSTPSAARGSIYACAKSSYSQMRDQHIQLELYRDQPAVISFDRPVTSVTFDVGSTLEPLAIDVRAEAHRGARTFDDGRVERLLDPDVAPLATLDLKARQRDTLTLVFDEEVRLVSLWSRSGGLQKLAIDNILYTYPECD